MLDMVWYDSLTKPFLQPPGWIFPPVWTVLYITLFTALVLYARKCKQHKFWGYFIFFVQMGLNLIWTPIFFGLKNIGLALVIIILMIILVLINIIEFYKISKSAARCLIPYFLWIIFAACLNAGIFILNIK